MSAENELFHSMDKKLDRLEDKADKILDKLENHHGRLVHLESLTGFMRIGITILIPIVGILVTYHFKKL